MEKQPVYTRVKLVVLSNKRLLSRTAGSDLTLRLETAVKSGVYFNTNVRARRLLGGPKYPYAKWLHGAAAPASQTIYLGKSNYYCTRKYDFFHFIKHFVRFEKNNA